MAEQETFEQFTDRINRANFRFAVGHPSRGFSTVWTAFGNRDDYYIGSRSFMGSQKVSLHTSGICRVALTSRQYDMLAEQGLPQPADRAATKWQRPRTPRTGAAHVASIIFPTDYLRIMDEPKGTRKKPLFIFEPAPPGQAIEFGIFYSREDEAAMEERYRQIGQAIVHTTLEGGEQVTVVARISSFDQAWLPLPAQMNTTRGNIISRAVLDTSGDLPNLTATLWNESGDGGTLKLVEIGGASLKRNPLGASLDTRIDGCGQTASIQRSPTRRA
jgi:hypothetical protein